MVSEKNLRRSIEERKREIDRLQAAYDREKNKKQLNAFCAEISKSKEMLELIKEKRLSVTDTRKLAKLLCKEIALVFNKYESIIRAKQNQRIAQLDSTVAPNTKTD